jgi:hypothetical protein
MKFFELAVPSSGFERWRGAGNLMDGSCLWWVACETVFNGLACGEEN